jgi:Calcium binding
VTDEIDALIAEVLVDAYGEDEQLWSFRQWFEDTATFPFRATVVGAEVEVIHVDYDGDDRRGLVARCTRDGQRQSVSLVDVAPTDSISTDTAALLAAYRRWANPDPRSCG